MSQSGKKFVVDSDQQPTVEELAELLKVGQKYLEQLDDLLADIRVPVRSTDTAVTSAIKNLFGEQYLNDNGSSHINYQMVRQCMNLMRNLGRTTAAEYVK